METGKICERCGQKVDVHKCDVTDVTSQETLRI